MAIFGYDEEPATKTPQEYCAEIADFLGANRDAWTQGAAARDGYGQACDSDDSDARRWCAIGLVEKFVRWPHMQNRCVRLLSRVVTPLGHSGRSPAAFNDMHGRKVDEVISMFRAASYLPTLPEDQMVPPMHEPVCLYGFGQSITEDQPMPEELPPSVFDTLNQASATAMVSFYATNNAIPVLNEARVIEVPNWTEMILKGSYGVVPQDMLVHLGKETVA